MENKERYVRARFYISYRGQFTADIPFDPTMKAEDIAAALVKQARYLGNQKWSGVSNKELHIYGVECDVG